MTDNNIPVEPFDPAADPRSGDIPIFLRRGACGLQFHRLANAFPMIEGAEFSALVESIKTGGLREPIVTYENQILDGRNRALACEVAGIEPTFTEFHGNDPLEFVIDLNLHRRQLNESQRAAVAAKIANMRQGERTDLEPSANLPKVGQAAAADLLNVSTRSVTNATKVFADGAPELVNAVERGEVAVSAAAIVAELSAAEQRDLVAKGNVAKAAREVRKKTKAVGRSTLKRKPKLVTVAQKDCSTGEIIGPPICVPVPDDIAAQIALDANPICKAWRLASEEDRAEFVGLFGDDLRRYGRDHDDINLDDAAEAIKVRHSTSCPEMK
jgi:ParB-like chromosome segregation protein Spo0J